MTFSSRKGRQLLRQPQYGTNILARFLRDKTLVHVDVNQCTLRYCHVVYEGIILSDNRRKSLPVGSLHL